MTEEASGPRVEIAVEVAGIDSEIAAWRTGRSEDLQLHSDLL
jgi:hypothetical protein